MAYVIIDNNVSNDTYGMRAARLGLIEAHIDEHEQSLSLPAALLAWAQGGYTAWKIVVVNQSAEWGEKEEAFQTVREADGAMYDRYVTIKELLLAAYGTDEEACAVYGIEGEIPAKRDYRISKVHKLVKGHEVQKAKGDPRVLPDAMIDGLNTLVETAETVWYKAINELDDAKDATVQLHGLYDADCIQLRMLYNWCCSMWGNKDTRLIELGFVQRKHHGGGQPAPPTGLKCIEETKEFSWDETHLATSYQLAYREYIKPDPDKKLPALDWEEAYQGADTTVLFDPGVGDWEFKVRARNKHGFGDFSEVISVNFHNGGILPAPTGFGFDDVKQKFSWDALAGALMYQLEISRDDGATWTQVYDDVDTYFDASLQAPGDVLARVRAIDGYMEPGDWSDPPLAVTFKLRTPTTLMYDQYRNQFTWDFIPGADGYEFELDDGSGSGFVQIYSGPNNHFVHALAKGTYKFRARAERDAEQSGWSNEFETVILFAAPTGLHYDSSAHKIKWDKVPGAAQYQLVNETGSVNYIGAKNEFGDMPSEPQKYRVRAGDGTMLVWGEWCAWTMLG